MSKSVLISIQPKWCELIASAKKTVEVRKSKPKLEVPFKVYIYCTKSRSEALWKYQGEYYYDTQFPNERPNKANGKVIGEFVCDEIIVAECGSYCKISMQASHMDAWDLVGYADEKTVYGWHISNLKIYEKPKELSEFYQKCDERCEACAFWKMMHVNADELDMDCSAPIYEHIPITRPPQSWCYVEDMEVVK